MACSDLASTHPGLRSWVECRNALLDFAVSPPAPLVSELYELTHVFDRSLMIATYALAERRFEDAARIARELQQSAFEAVKTACCVTISPEPSRGRIDCSVNIMIPVSRAESTLLPSWKSCFERSEQLWSGLESHKRLIIVGETDPGIAGAGHSGFWVPVIRAEGGPLPGATTAVMELRPSSVFKDALPSLTDLGFSKALRESLVRSHERTF